ncbi:MAG TPA: TonB family protein [Blastocatellia bacterium]|nr:TonB family protein [Blastocatellia bacterium]
MKRSLLPMGVVTALMIAALCGSMPARAAQQNQPEPPKIIRKSGGVLQGSATRRVEPAYPPLAKTARISGAVVVEVTVDETGKVISARAISGHPLLKDSATNAARGWEFTPTMLQGTPVKVIGTITFNFALYTKEDIERMKQQIAEKPNDAELYARLGDMYAETWQDEDALGAYRQALMLEPNHYDAWMGMGNVEKRQGHVEAAIDAFKQAAQSPARENPKSFNAFALMRLAEIYYEQQRYQEVVETYKQVVAHGGMFDSQDYVRLATAYIKLGDKESAMEQYRKLKEMDYPYAERLLKQINGQQ